MLKICLVFWESEPQYAYKRYAYKKTCILCKDLYLAPVNNLMGLYVNLDQYGSQLTQHFTILPEYMRQ